MTMTTTTTTTATDDEFIVHNEYAANYGVVSFYYYYYYSLFRTFIEKLNFCSLVTGNETNKKHKKREREEGARTFG